MATAKKTLSAKRTEEPILRAVAPTHALSLDVTAGVFESRPVPAERPEFGDFPAYA